MSLRTRAARLVALLPLFLAGCLGYPGQGANQPIEGMVILPDGSPGYSVAGNVISSDVSEATAIAALRRPGSAANQVCPGGFDVVHMVVADRSRTLIRYVGYQGIIRCHGPGRPALQM